MTPRIPGSEVEALEVFLEGLEVVDYMAGWALSAAYAGDIESVKRKLHVLRFYVKYNMIDLLAIKDGEDL